MDVLADLDARGLIHQTTDRQALAQRLESGPITVYCGFDPTAASLHVGNLMGLLTLRRLQLGGHRPIALAGGATGMVGDPSGRSTERNLLDDDALAGNLEGIVPQLRQFLDFDDGPCAARLLDNRAWTVGVGVLDFLRDVGKHVTVQQMVGKESVRNRLNEGDGLSYTEFSYMLLQAYDYLWLAENVECELQVGGSDQWGNIVLGIDLIRRRLGRAAHALTWPLLARSDGTKYGKTAGGETLWLSAEAMSPYRFYQSWIGVDDVDIARLLAQLTFLDMAEVREIAAAHDADPGRRSGQRRLAAEITRIVHGDGAATAAAGASEVLFGGGVPVRQASAAALAFVSEEVPSGPLRALGASVVDVLVDAELAQSRSEARRALAEGSVYINGERTSDPDRVVDASDLLHGRYVLLRRGKKRWHAATAP
ncbi:tyrosine--tRNA ligase [Candidatus Poriferisodalis sp.]|uniref:tyrosine--tRNA ligase n=1 Tax=Candidatus Poriferisodalis sp. TaxID=3101277 RepID=UPI003B02BCD0